ncbi:DUF2092 domain-containing protein [Polynucleobacter asymbioticus]|uniref:DUF2092 domain-containing protein n=1 Tax=Polynucleobacter asymbioticus TaxID=576611 RepID=UPI001BFE9066|nr:DUF2092 domain-containing protein [Polynucleobacter asymbioticus]QWD84802.1 DUF2092 domain-containing protein [Polynucleobacter asymbioticus]
MYSFSKIVAALVSCCILGVASAQSANINRPEAGKRPQLPKGMTAIEPAALELLKAMTDKLAAAKSMQFEALVLSEFPSIDGLPVIYSTAAKVALQRPNKFDVVVWGDGPSSEVLFNGKQLFAYSPEKNLVAVTSAPSNIDEAAKFAYDKAGLFFPGDDLILSNPYAHLTQGLTDAFIVGKTKLVGGVETNVIVMAGRELQGQIWIGAKDNLPYMASWIYLGDKSLPRTTLQYKNWKLNSSIPGVRFDASRFSKALTIEFAQPDAPLN